MSPRTTTIFLPSERIVFIPQKHTFAQKGASYPTNEPPHCRKRKNKIPNAPAKIASLRAVEAGDRINARKTAMITIVNTNALRSGPHNGAPFNAGCAGSLLPASTLRASRESLSISSIPRSHGSVSFSSLQKAGSVGIQQAIRSRNSNSPTTCCSVDVYWRMGRL